MVNPLGLTKINPLTPLALDASMMPLICEASCPVTLLSTKEELPLVYFNISLPPKPKVLQ